MSKQNAGPNKKKLSTDFQNELMFDILTERKKIESREVGNKCRREI